MKNLESLLTTTYQFNILNQFQNCCPIIDDHDNEIINETKIAGLVQFKGLDNFALFMDNVKYFSLNKVYNECYDLHLSTESIAGVVKTDELYGEKYYTYWIERYNKTASDNRKILAVYLRDGSKIISKEGEKYE